MHTQLPAGTERPGLAEQVRESAHVPLGKGSVVRVVFPWNAASCHLKRKKVFPVI